MSTTCTIDGLGPLPLVRPESVEELGELIRQAAANGTALYAVGGQTHLSLGNPPTKVGQAVDLRGLNRIIDFPARDMTVTVQAGITIAELHKALAKENLRLPIDVPQSERATLGGILAANISGPRRYGFGTLRDQVIGISAVNDEGREFKAGGRVVKNVAGYDICKLLVGSLGTLGIITQATLRLRPLPEHHALVTLGCESTELEPLLTALHESRTRPVAIELLNTAAAEVVLAAAERGENSPPWKVLVGYEGNFDAVGWQVQQLVKEVGTRDRLHGHVDAPAEPIWGGLIELAAWREAELTMKAAMLPSTVAQFCDAVRGGDVVLRAHAGNGIVTGQWPGGLVCADAVSIVNEWRELAAAGQGSVVVTKAPSAWKSAFDIWGPAPNDAWLMRDIKAKFDPLGIFNPGRFLDGI